MSLDATPEKASKQHATHAEAHKLMLNEVLAHKTTYKLSYVDYETGKPPESQNCDPNTQSQAQYDACKASNGNGGFKGTGRFHADYTAPKSILDQVRNAQNALENSRDQDYSTYNGGQSSQFQLPPRLQQSIRQNSSEHTQIVRQLQEDLKTIDTPSGLPNDWRRSVSQWLIPGALGALPVSARALFAGGSHFIYSRSNTPLQFSRHITAKEFQLAETDVRKMITSTNRELNNLQARGLGDLTEIESEKLEKFRDRKEVLDELTKEESKGLNSDLRKLKDAASEGLFSEKEAQAIRTKLIGNRVVRETDIKSARFLLRKPKAAAVADALEFFETHALLKDAQNKSARQHQNLMKGLEENLREEDKATFTKLVGKINGKITKLEKEELKSLIQDAGGDPQDDYQRLRRLQARWSAFRKTDPMQDKELTIDKVNAQIKKALKAGEGEIRSYLDLASGIRDSATTGNFESVRSHLKVGENGTTDGAEEELSRLQRDGELDGDKAIENIAKHMLKKAPSPVLSLAEQQKITDRMTSFQNLPKPGKVVGAKWAERIRGGAIDGALLGAGSAMAVNYAAALMKDKHEYNGVLSNAIPISAAIAISRWGENRLMTSGLIGTTWVLGALADRVIDGDGTTPHRATRFAATTEGGAVTGLFGGAAREVESPVAKIALLGTGIVAGLYTNWKVNGHGKHSAEYMAALNSLKDEKNFSTAAGRNRQVATWTELAKARTAVVLDTQKLTALNGKNATTPDEVTKVREQSLVLRLASGEALLSEGSAPTDRNGWVDPKFNNSVTKSWWNVLTNGLGEDRTKTDWDRHFVLKKEKIDFGESALTQFIYADYNLNKIPDGASQYPELANRIRVDMEKIYQPKHDIEAAFKELRTVGSYGQYHNPNPAKEFYSSIEGRLSDDTLSKIPDEQLRAKIFAKDCRDYALALEAFEGNIAGPSDVISALKSVNAIAAAKALDPDNPDLPELEKIARRSFAEKGYNFDEALNTELTKASADPYRYMQELVSADSSEGLH